MAKVIVPEGSGAPRIRNFDAVTAFDPSGRVLYTKKVSGTWVLGTEEDGTRKLFHYAAVQQQRFARSYESAFWLVLGIWLAKVLERFAQF